MEMMKPDKKGFFFTILALFLVLLLLSTVTMIHQNFLVNSDLTEGIRIDSMNSFLDDLERDMNRAFYITSFRSVNSLTNYVTSKGNYLDDFNKRFSESFFNGTIENNYQGIMLNSTFNDWILRIQGIAKTYGINISIEPIHLRVTQNNPWYLDVNLTVSVKAQDESKIAYWDYNLSENTSVSILGFEDPIYAIASSGRLFNSINKTPFTNFVNGNDTSNLKLQILNSYYLSNPQAPNFMMRLEGNFSSSENGIESLFYLPDFSAQDLQTYDRCAVDYVYLSGNSSEIYIINNTYETWFRLDNEHLSVYGVEDLKKPIS